jgi:hypothetical protein
MANEDSFRFKSNAVKNGDTLTICVEGLAYPAEYVGKTCKIEIYEVDSPLSKSDILATFDAVIDEDNSVTPPKYFFKNPTRTDTFPNTLPGPETRTNTDSLGNSWAYMLKPKWNAPHFKLSFELKSGNSASHLVLIKEANLDREEYIFEIGFKVYIGDKIKHEYMAKRSYCTLDARGALAENCKLATELLMMDHRDMINRRSIGTHYGSEYFPSDPAEQVSFTSAKVRYKLKVGSCIEYVLEACQLGHEKTLSSKDWAFIKGHMVKGMGMAIGEGFAKAGWMGVYFNPDVKHPFDGNTEKHNYTYAIAKSKRRYQAVDTRDNNRLYKFSVKQLVINYAPTTVYENGTIETNVTPQDTTQINKLKQVPFGVVNVSGGTHTALFSKGYIYEIHWDKSHTDPVLFERTLLENWGWLSGAIQIPEGTWPV